MRELSKIFGVGDVTAVELMRAGAKSVEDLMDEKGNPLEMYSTVKITNSMKLGVQFFEATNTKMPRAEVEDIAQAVRGCISTLLPGGAGAYELIPAGSYRRGAGMCGDCDCFLSRLDGGSVYELICDLLDFLDPTPPPPGDPTGGVSKGVAGSHGTGIRLVRLIAPSAKSAADEEGDAFHVPTFCGLISLGPEGPWRRVDIKGYPKKFKAYALLHMTGDDLFNRSLRLFASKKATAMSLSDKGLRPVLRDRNRAKQYIGDHLLDAETEEEVFAFLGVPYSTPAMRSVKTLLVRP